MNGSIAYMAKHKARGVGIGQEGRIRARVEADFFLVRLQCGDDRTALLALGERLGGEGVLRLVIWSASFWACQVGYLLAAVRGALLGYLPLRHQRTISRWPT